MKKLLLLAALSLSGVGALAQSITVGALPSPLCFDTPVDIPVTLTGTFASGNQFSVGLAKLYGRQEYAEFPAEVVDGGKKLRVRIDRGPFGEIGVGGDPFRLRVLASNPRLVSDWTPGFWGVSGLPTLALGENTLTLNPFNVVTMRATASGAGPVFAVLEDRLTGDTLAVRLASNVSSYSLFGYPVEFRLPFEKPVEYTVRSVRNACGVGQGSGFVRARVNPFGLQTTGLAPAAACEGTAVWVNFSRTAGDYGPANRFKIRLTAEQEDRPYAENPDRVVEVDAALENGALKFTVPGGLARPGARNRFSVRVISTDPAAVGTPQNHYLAVSAPPSVTLRPLQETVPFGESTSLFADVTGLPPYEILLSDGTRLRDGQQQEYQSPFPTEAHLFFSYESVRVPLNLRVVSASTGCGAARLPGAPTVVPVGKGVVFDSIPRFACEGQVCRVRIRTDRNLDGPVTVRLTNSGYYNPFIQKEVAGVIAGNTLRFTVPSLAFEGRSVEERLFTLQLDFGDYQTNDRDAYLEVQGPPRFAFVEWAQNLVINDPAEVMLGYNRTGGGTPLVTFADGTAWSAEFSAGMFPVYAPRTTTFTVVKIANECFATPLTESSTVTVRNPAPVGILAKRPPERFCAKDSLTLEFSTFGTFGTGNRFSVQIADFNGQFVTQTANVTASRNGVFRVKLSPSNLSRYKLRLASSDPVTFSAEFDVYAFGTPSISKPYFSWGETIEPGQATQGSFTTRGWGPWQVVISAGTRDSTYRFAERDDFETSLSINFQPTRTTTYTVRSVTDACETFRPADDRTFTINVLPAERIFWPAAVQGVFNGWNGSAYGGFTCASGRLVLPFGTAGAFTENSRFTLQMKAANEPDSRFTELMKDVRGTRFELDWPANLTYSEYTFRVISTNPNAVSPPLSFYVQRPLKATLRAENGTARVQAEPFQTVRLPVTVEGGTSGTAYWSDGVQVSTSFVREVTVSRRQTYFLKAIENGCGYGSVEGKVDVSVRPNLSFAGSSTLSDACVGGSLAFNYVGSGDFEPGNFFRVLLVSPTGRITQLDTTRNFSGPRTVRLPTGVSPGTYELRVEATQPSLLIKSTFRLFDKPSYRLSGNTTINSAQATNLVLTNNALPQAEDVFYRLSDGTAGQFRTFNPQTTVIVRPAATTTYRIVELSNQCGIGQGSGTAVVTVNPPAERSVRVTNALARTGQNRICAGDTLFVTYLTAGAFSTGNVFTVQLSDSTGQNFRDYPTAPYPNGLRAAIPASLPRGDNYRVRVVASDVGTASGAFVSALPVSYSATGRFAASEVFVLPGVAPRLPLVLAGDAPWTFLVGFGATNTVYTSQVSPDSVRLSVNAPTGTYRIVSLSNVCGVGRILDPATIRVELITATEPVPGVSVRVFPNPTTGRLQVKSERADAYALELIDASGRVLLERRENQGTSEVDLADRLPGLYLLRVRQGSNTAVYKVVKE
jgi:hypothetical protein